MSHRTLMLAALVVFGLTTGAFTSTEADTRAADRRAAAEALSAFSDAIRGVTYEYKQARMTAGADLLRKTNGFNTGDRFLTGAYYAALPGRDEDLRSARDWLDSFLIVGTRTLKVGSADEQKIEEAIARLEEFEKASYSPARLSEVMAAVRETQAFASGHVHVSDAAIKIGFALERTHRGWWFVPLTARWEAHRAANALRSAIKQG